MKIRKRIVQIGKSDGVIIDKVIMGSLKLKRGNLVEINIKKITNEK